MPLDNEARLAKNAQIAKTMKETRERRSKMTCRSIELKINSSTLSTTKKEAIDRLFLEAKWVFNDALSTDEPWNYVPGKTVTVKKYNGDFEERQLTTISVQQKQDVVKGLCNSITSLSTLKKNRHKVGRIKYKRQVNSIPLRYHTTTYEINRDRSRVRIQNIGWVRVHGLGQLTDGMECANAVLIRRPNGYYIKVTTYSPPEEDEFVPGTVVGIDMGVATHLTLSTGEKFSILIEETPQLRRLQRKAERQRAQKKKCGRTWDSKAYKRTLRLIRREYEKMDRKKDEIAHQIVHRIMKNEFMFFQNENISEWKIKFGGKIHHSILGRVKQLLMEHKRAYCINKWSATTQMCTECGRLNKIPLSQRTYKCDCGYVEDRDIHSADNMILLGIAEHHVHVPAERGEFKPVLVNEDGYLQKLGCEYTRIEREHPSEAIYCR